MCTGTVAYTGCAAAFIQPGQLAACSARARQSKLCHGQRNYSSHTMSEFGDFCIRGPTVVTVCCLCELGEVEGEMEQAHTLTAWCTGAHQGMQWTNRAPGLFYLQFGNQSQQIRNSCISEFLGDMSVGVCASLAECSQGGASSTTGS